ncbi:MAG TPA: DEAD/DEAH box helicase [Pseudogracilibacillus sp.]|nr:DEAD/DEAH box helicase [Pseudogracilibacillus sp.]
MNIDEFATIRSMFPERIFKRGLNYYKNGNVIGLSYNRHEKVWFAEVVGTDTYYVEVKGEQLSKDVLDWYCDCPAFLTYRTCKHIVSVLLEMSKRRAFQSNQNHSLITERFIDWMTQHQSWRNDSIDGRIPMEVEYIITFHYRQHIHIQLRTGISHRYVVHHVRDLLTHVLNDNGYEFTKKFSYDPEQHYFLQQDLELFRDLFHFIETGDFFSERTYGINDHYDRREVPIPPLFCKQFLEKLQHRNVVVEVDKKQYKNISLLSEKLPSAFHLTYDEKEELVLEADIHDELVILKPYRMLFHEGTFYFPTEDQWHVFETVWRFDVHKNPLSIQKEQKNTFFSEVLPVMEQASNVEIEPEVQEEIVHYPLRATLYLAQEEDVITGSLAYHYGTYTFDPFQPSEPTDRIVLRQVDQEEEIMRLIEQANFRYNGRDLTLHLDDDEATYEFLYTILPLLDEKLELYLTDSLQRLVVEREPVPSTNVHVEESTGLLSINFDISDVEEEEVDELIRAVIEKQRFYRLKSGSLISLEKDSFRSLHSLFHELGTREVDLENGSIQVPVYKGLQVDELLETEKRYTPQFRKLLHQLTSPEEQVYTLPDTLEATLRSYQETGFQWFKSLHEYKLGGILADDMGLGKTVQTIAFLLDEQTEHPHLVVVPSSVVYNWKQEFAKFAPSLNVTVIAGTKEERQELIQSEKEADVWITSYGTLRQDIELYRLLHFNVLILDEAQYIKNYRTKTSQAVRKLQTLNRFALTGTPIENSLQELWSIFQVVLPGLLPPAREFTQWNTEKISRLIQPFMLRRVKEDVLKDLPEKIESVHVSQLTKEQKKLYLGYLRELQQETAKSLASNQFQQNRMKILAGLTRLRQLCCHPGMFIENYEGHSGKLDELMETVRKYIADGRRMLIFSQFTSMHEIIIKELEKEGIDYFYLEGQTPSEERVKMSEAFNAGEKSVFLISLRAGGTGLNLTGADTVILFDLWWNPAVEDQAAGRAHRFGQKNVVNVIRFITEGTIEERIYELQQKKRELIDKVVQPGETMLQSLSEEDIRELLNL